MSSNFLVDFPGVALTGFSYYLISGQTGVTLAASATVNDSTVFSFKADKRSKRWVRVEVVTNNAGTPSVPLAVALFARKKISGTGAGYFTATS